MKSSFLKIDLSILIATYNSEKFIGDCLKSILECFEQQNFSFEIVIKDGGSSDSTSVIVKEFEDRLPINFIANPDKGIYNAMNHEIESSRGEWLYFLGSDDILLDGMIDLIIEARTGNYDLIYGDVYLKNDKRNYDGIFDKKKLFQAPPPHQGSIFKRSLFEKYGNYNEDYFICSDYDRFLLFFSKNEIKRKYIQTTVAIFNDDGFSRSGPKDICFARDRTKLIEKYFNKEEFDHELQKTFLKIKRKDAIMVIDDGSFLIEGLKMYFATIKLSDDHLTHIRYLLGSLKNYLLGKSKRQIR